MSMSWCFLFLLLSLFQTCFLSSPSPQLCLHDERSALLQFKQRHYHDPPDYHLLNSWKPNTDCCCWEGITCNGTTGHVVGVDLSYSSLYGPIHSNSSLFHLHHLQMLNLSSNGFNYFAPSGFYILSRLLHLNLSANYFVGQIPSQISQLTDLVSLDLSLNSFSGQIPSEISNLTKLVSLDLSSNSFSGQIPFEISNLTKLVSLDLSWNSFSGQIPSEISNLTKLVSLDLSFNGDEFHQLEIPDLRAFVQNLYLLRELRLDGVILAAQKNRDWSRHLSSTLPNLQVLSMSGCSLIGPLDALISSLHFLSELSLDNNYNLSSTIPVSLMNLTSLTVLSLSGCGFRGNFPSNVFLLPNMQYIDLTGNLLLSGHLPEFHQVNTALQSLYVGDTKFQGKLPSSIGNLISLEILDLSGCNFSGPIPPSLGNLTHLSVLFLSENNFSGQLPSFPRESFPNLEGLSLEDNLLQGPICSYLFLLPSIYELDLSRNQFSGIINEPTHNISSFSSPQKLLPRSFLDMSSNKIGGAIPKWIWQKNWTELYLYNNLFTGLELPLPNHSFNIEILDLHSNMIEECHSTAPCFLQTLNQSNGEFLSPILGNLTTILSKASFFSISNNKLTGKIPSSICNASYLDILDLSNNQLSGTIPTCLGNSNLRVLNLENNKLYGPIPPAFREGCNIQSFKVNKNMLQGEIPRMLGNCTGLTVLDVADNQLNGTFPYWLGNLTGLQVLVMRYNKFAGPIALLPQTDSFFPSLHVIDLSCNNFTGNLPLQYIYSWKAMMFDNDTFGLSYIMSTNVSTYYYDTLEIMDKGLYMKMERILTTFFTVDLSNNNFKGEIPDALGILIALKVLNLSGNSLTGQIPFSLGSLRELESLDLSRNKLSGEIPRELTSLTFLEVLNLSYNNFTGRIPQGNQFDTFSNASYEGNNAELCGLPLSRKCGIKEDGASPPTSGFQQEDDSTSVLDWKFALAGYCSGLTVGLIVGQQLFWRRNRCSEFISKIVVSKQRKRSRKIKHHNRGK